MPLWSLPRQSRSLLWLFFFNDTATTEIYTLSLHDALPISCACKIRRSTISPRFRPPPRPNKSREDRKSTRLNSSHVRISYAVFCLKKKIATPRVGGIPGTTQTDSNGYPPTLRVPRSDFAIH